MGEALYQPSNQSQELSNEQLFWAAYGAGGDADQLFGIGGMIDERIDTLADELHRQYLDTGETSLDQCREHIALRLAQEHIDITYGRLTGYKRTGCSMGSPVRYRG